MTIQQQVFATSDIYDHRMSTIKLSRKIVFIMGNNLYVDTVGSSLVLTSINFLVVIV